VTRLPPLSLFLAFFSLALALGSCNGQGWTDPGPDAGVDRTHAVAGASFDDQIRLCDWLAGRLGGYNRTRKCGQIPITSGPNQSACIASLEDITTAECTFNFGEFEDCLNAIINGPCTDDDIPRACYILADCRAFQP